MRIWVKFAVFIGLCFGIGYAAHRIIPVQHVPWRALNPDAPIGFATKTQLLRLSVSPSNMCMDMADNLPQLSSLPAQAHRPYKSGKNKICGWDIARDVQASAHIKLIPDSVDMQCPLSIASHLWLQEINQIALDEMGRTITGILHYGTYSCRKQNGNNSGQWSEHAFANAWDVAGFELSDGRMIIVKSDWNGEADKARFLKRARNMSCQIFNVTLSPDYNAAHADHFHLDMGPNRACR